MTVRVFGSQAEFVAVLTGLPTPDGGVFCTTYLPSALFPKSSLATFYTDRQGFGGAEAAVDQLWTYGRKLMRYLSSGRCRLILEDAALEAFVNDGRVHAAVPQFEVNHRIRADVLTKLGRLAGETNVTVTAGPVPFVFRLVPPAGVLIDVAHNTVDQLVQGLWLDDADAYGQFAVEAERLAAVDGALSGDSLVERLAQAVQRLETGRLPFWA